MRVACIQVRVRGIAIQAAPSRHLGHHFDGFDLEVKALVLVVNAAQSLTAMLIPAEGPVLIAEILELAGNAARDNKKTGIIPSHLQLAVRNAEELNKLLGEVNIAQGGLLPNIQAMLLPKRTSSVTNKK
ncbi:hypothetical protein scyTo_0015333 [Scyliorhinus torazame]|uniref:Histone H2A n=1 Tax=Scyliorhinus torazame TaxID=75743 RepID=A0A401PQX8_SCYTO|nr:hypothetical protein [Scyliorhinus torazame]